MITVIDSPCGHGKTTYAIDMINQNQTKSYIYITPYLDEVNRIIEDTKILGKIDRFHQPQYNGEDITKMDNFIKRIKKGEDIASTHALFKKCTEELIGLIKKGNYTLILDEVMQVVEVINLKDNSLDLLLESNCIKIDEKTRRVTWLKDPDYDTEYNYLKELCLSGEVYIVNGVVLVWTFPCKIFEAFEDVYICTYMFHAQIQKYYYDLHKVKYEIKSIFNGELIKYASEKDNVHLIDILQKDKLNLVGEEWYNLSDNWYRKYPKMRKVLRKNMLNCATNIWKAKSSDIIWTTFKSYKGSVQGKGFTNGFVPLNKRATNAYQTRHYIMYTVNVFVNPFIVKYFNKYDIKIDEDGYALSEMIQFIWRSAIRSNEPIHCYIPSRRMRSLLVDYILNY